ncbi:MAG: hypothetical protein WD646_08455 [Actinomycetota bacterium]
MKPKIVAIAAALLLVASACDRLPFAGRGGDQRTVLVDFGHDSYASFFLFNFPKKIAVTPGMTLVFRQTWTGEPHTVTGGTLVDETLGDPILSFATSFDELAAAGVPLPDPEGEVPEDMTVADVIEIVEDSRDSDARQGFLDSYDALAEDGVVPDRDEATEVAFIELAANLGPEIEAAFTNLPHAVDEGKELETTQNIGQPCYLSEGGPPEDPDQPCASGDQDKPDFDGTQSYYNSGIIPYEGPQGNTFEVPLAEDIEVGSYWFYCAVHGPLQSTEVEVRPTGSDIPSQAEVNRRARREIDEVAEPLLELYRTAVDSNEVRVNLGAGPQTLEGPFAGLGDVSVSEIALINEFVPKQLEVDAGDPITWTMIGAPHTISFGVPRYFPPVQFLDDGSVRVNPRLQPAAGGAKEFPAELFAAPGQEGGPGAEVVEFDGGTYDGEGFWSSGLIAADPYAEYTMRISRPGTYDFACLIHPPMVGTIEVT